MQLEKLWQSRIVQTILVIVVTIIALMTALIVVPPLARQAGLFEQHVGYATAAAAFLIVFAAVRWLKSLNQKSADKSGTAPRKR